MSLQLVRGEGIAYLLYPVRMCRDSDKNDVSIADPNPARRLASEFSIRIPRYPRRKRKGAYLL